MAKKPAKPTPSSRAKKKSPSSRRVKAKATEGRVKAKVTESRMKAEATEGRVKAKVTESRMKAEATPSRVQAKATEWVSVNDPSLEIANPCSAGIDVHSREHWVCVPAVLVTSRPKNHPANLPSNVRSFGATTGELERLADWLIECGITTVAMESTGVYWIPLFELLERRGLLVVLANPGQTRQVSGRPKTDVLDCQWIQRLHSYGLLRASFRPNDETCVLRSYLRQRKLLIEDAARSIQHMQKALEQMNVKLAEVVSDITGCTGMRILKAILEGDRDPDSLARHRHGICKSSAKEIAAALHGNWRAEHLFALQQAMKTLEHFRGQLRDCDTQVEEYLKSRPDQSAGRPLPNDPKRTRTIHPTEPNFDARTLSFQWSGKDLTVIEGIGPTTALTLLSEIGWDMSKWPTEKHFSSWLGLCPQHRGSGGRIKRRRMRGGANRAAQALRMAAQGCHHAKNAMGAYYRRIQARAGGMKAVTATARRIACRVYRLLKNGEEYVRQEMAAYEEMFRVRQMKNLAKKATELGFKLVPTDSQVQAG